MPQIENDQDKIHNLCVEINKLNNWTVQNLILDGQYVTLKLLLTTRI